MHFENWRLLQLFAEGGDGGASPSGEAEAADAGQARLLELGVPADKLRRRAKKAETPLPQGAVRTEPKRPEAPAEQEPDAAADEKRPTEKSRMSWEEVCADPEYNQKMQEMVQGRLRADKPKVEAMDKLQQALALLAGKHGLDPDNIDYGALAQKIVDDDSFYEDRAMEMGVGVDTAKRIVQMEQETARLRQQEQRSQEEQRFAAHLQSLQQQGEALKATFPGFDLSRELQNPVFARMTSPGGGISVEDAYYAVHRRELQEAAMRVSARKTAEQISNTIQARGTRPSEAGTGAPSVSTFDYRKASKAEREALKQRIRQAAARNEKLYPGQ